MRAVLLVILIGCDAGERTTPPPPSPTPVAPKVVVDAAPPLFGDAPGTLGLAFAGLQLGQVMDANAAKAWMAKVPADLVIRDGRLVTISVQDNRDPPSAWGQGTSNHGEMYWGHATQQISERAITMQFDLEVPIDQWLNTTTKSIVPVDLVAKPLDAAEGRSLLTQSNFVDGVAHTSWIDSALEGADSATAISVIDYYDKNDPQKLVSHEVDISLNGSHAIYTAIDHRITELFGASHKKIKLEHTPVHEGIENIQLILSR
ncbi:MAG: hypothetical protein QM831_36580 [Kofleriaceae bacterium]